MAPSSSTAARLRLSLRWKAFGMLLLLLAVVHAFFGFFVYRELLNQYRQDETERLDGLRQSFDGQLLHSAQDLGRIGAQIVASTSLGDLARHGFDSARLSPELLGNLSGMELFDPHGNALAGFQLPGSQPIPAIVRSQSLPRVRQHHRPVSSLVCTEECIQYVAEPAFDQDGHELLVVLGQPLSEVMLAFARQTGTDHDHLVVGSVAW
ncbi:MAG: hypothetical protein OSA97_08145, partial [Nevskia sp.]|nr:hypothetical protein [Nevskia sp.]